MVDERLTSGDGRGTSGDGGSTDAEEELTDRDPGSGDGGSGDDGLDIPGSVYDDIGGGSSGSDSSSGGGGGGGGGRDRSTDRGITSGSGETTTDPTDSVGSNDSGSTSGRDRSTDHGITSGDGDTTTEPSDQSGSQTDQGGSDTPTRQQPDDVQERATEVVAEDTRGDGIPGTNRTGTREPDLTPREKRARDRLVANNDALDRGDVTGVAVGAAAELGLVTRNRPNLDPDDVVAIPTAFSDDFRRRQARDQLVEQGELSESDIAGVQQTEEGFTPEFTQSYLADEAERIAAELGAAVDAADVSFERTNDGAYQPELDADARQALAREQFEAGVFGGRRPSDGGFTPGANAEQVTTNALQRFERGDFEVSPTESSFAVGLSENAAREDALQQLDDSLEAQTGVSLERGEDYTVRETDDGGLQANLKPGYGSKQARIEQARQQDDIFSDAVVPLSYTASLAGVESPVQGSIINQARVEREFRQSQDESGRPGTIARAPVPFTDLNLVQTLEAGSEGFQSDIVQPIAQTAGDIAERPAGAILVGPAPSGYREDVTEGVVSGAGAVVDLPGVAAGTLRLGQQFSQTPGDPGAAAEIARGGAAAGGDLAQATVDNPARTAGSIAAVIATGAAGGRALGSGTRFARDRVRTAGAKTFDIDDDVLVNQQTGKYYQPRSDVDDPEARFPGAENPTLYETDPPAAVRSQADDYTPSSVEERFREEGVEGGTTLKKALDVEPDDGPGRGFATQEGSYESPGGFVGPELSPNFLGIQRQQRTFSFRPGVPDTGDQATGVLVQTRVGRSDADTLDEFNQELLDREGETTARTKPAGEVHTGEIEAVIPPEAEFADIGGGLVRTAARRAGVGSDFAVRIGGRTIPGTDRKVGGRKIPIRPVADPDLVESSRTRSFGDFLRSERGQLGTDAASGPRTQTLGEIARPVRPAVDRPLPIIPSPTGTIATQTGQEVSQQDVGRTDEMPQSEPSPLRERLDNASGSFLEEMGNSSGGGNRRGSDPRAAESSPAMGAETSTGPSAGQSFDRSVQSVSASPAPSSGGTGTDSQQPALGVGIGSATAAPPAFDPGTSLLRTEDSVGAGVGLSVRAGIGSEPGETSYGGTGYNPRQRRDVGRDVGASRVDWYDTPVSSGEDPLFQGWLSETFFDITTTGTEIPEAPSQETLRSQPGATFRTGEFPTAQELDDPEIAAGIDDVRALFDAGVDDGDEPLFDFGFGSEGDSLI
jgi:hypothetical protein